MELKSGYKQTDVGIIPDDWVLVEISSIVQQGKKYGIVDGPFGSNLKTIHYRKSGIPIISSGYVTEGKFIADSYLYVNEDKFRQEKRSAVFPGDIVMAKIGARCGASAILPLKHEIGILSGNALKIAVDQNRYSTYFIWQVLNNLYIRGDLGAVKSVGAQPAVSMPDLKKFMISLPPIKAEQTAIANALSDADAWIQSITCLIAKKRQIKQGAMQTLLNPYENGQLKEGWVIKSLGDICKPSNTRINPRLEQCNYKCIELEHISQETGKILGFIDSKRQLSQKAVFNKGDVLFSKLRPYLKKYFYAEFDGVCSTEIWVLKFDKNINSRWLYYLVQSDHVIDAANQSTGTKMPRAEWSVVKNTDIGVPTNTDEQNYIAGILTDMDDEISSLESKLEKAQQIKQGMMQNLLTGRIRLI